MNKYTPVIGLEVHVELKTESKMFCTCSANYFGQTPNTHTCPVCLGLPGALPVPNKNAIEWCMMIAKALKCELAKFSKFDRKNYFYPDLPKGYQISQYDLPFGEHGFVELKTGKRIGITRVHMEEDTGKLIHESIDGEKVSLIDFNRSGVPLVEIVTEPDFETGEEVVEYLQKLRQIVRYLDVSNADMEKGDMRLEPNISLRPEGQSILPNYKVEVKNINSFRFVEKAINYEVKRQAQLLNNGDIPVQETRGWNEKHNRTDSQRVKEEANDYRYFPEPDIPPIRMTMEQLKTIEDSIPELPDQKIERFQKTYGLSVYDSEILTRERALAEYFEEAVRAGKDANVSPKQLANAIINRKVDITATLPAKLAQSIYQSSQTVVIDEEKLDEIIRKVIQQNVKAVNDYTSGKETVIMFLVGQVMREYKEKIDAQIVKERLASKLN